MISKSNVKFADSEVRMASIIKQLLDSVFVISGIIKVSVSVINLSLRLLLITLTSTLIIPDITKTSSNNCLKLSSTATSRKVVRKIVHATTPKGNMGYDKYTVPDNVAVEPTFDAFL